MSTLEKSVEKGFEGRKIREYLKEEMGLSSRLIRGAAMDENKSLWRIWGGHPGRSETIPNFV